MESFRSFVQPLTAALTAVFFSAFIVLLHFGITHPVWHTLCALTGLALFIQLNTRSAYLLSGFLIGVFWFYWVSLSFRYYDLDYLIPLVMLGMALIPTVIFWAIHQLRLSWLRMSALALIGYVQPFGFNWFLPEAMLAYSYFGIEKWQFLALLGAIWLVSRNNYWSLLAAPLITASISYDSPEIPPPSTRIMLTETHWTQDAKWNPANRGMIIEHNLALIDQAVAQNYDAILLPESAFPMILQQHPKLIDLLKIKSREIAIITGALDLKNGGAYNSTFLINRGMLTVANKMVLVPFGEKVPLPQFARDFINDLFFNGANDYFEADAPTDFTIHGESFRNAICYEATTDVIYTKSPHWVLATSNNAWFTPSTEPALQQALLKYYARKYSLIIYHSTNRSTQGIITP